VRYSKIDLGQIAVFGYDMRMIERPTSTENEKNDSSAAMGNGGNRELQFAGQTPTRYVPWPLRPPYLR